MGEKVIFLQKFIRSFFETIPWKVLLKFWAGCVFLGGAGLFNLQGNWLWKNVVWLFLRHKKRA